MKTFAALSAAALTVLGAAAAATPSFAQDYGRYGYGYGYADPCQTTQHDRGTTGAVLGGIAGALLGSNLASHHGGRAGGAALGAVAGAVIGNNIGRSSAKSSDACEARDYGQVAWRRPAPDYGYRDDGYRAYRYREDVRYRPYDPYGY
ncbi:MAG TPA: glycine zipper 2TM domain-containing protein [Phenylobacterium sp.]|uniref:glycine zipper 2TM domain-containing protein n=1 Tax=Phenylobacterium sp. TaxID=1871053 RepID=UPI002B47FAC8|nr:glycine zipper 2TM domain-containing protein [Phenylobacterium sp.]HKR87668.1 glycine zipper 2TM domain-containing protein [Phenylobacterium sp.]